MKLDNNPTDDKIFVENLINGREDAFTVLYYKYSPRLYRHILRMVKSEETARELLQDIFMKVWELRAGLDMERSFQAYLYRIAENKVYDFFRKAARDKKLGDALIASAIESYSHIEEMVLHDESLRLVQGAIDQLPPVRRQVFMLCKIEGKTYEEIASTLGISVSTISDHIVKANRALKTYLHGHTDIAISWAFWIAIRTLI
jgi:RNA polymerase sigma-70 factor (family 1)